VEEHEASRLENGHRFRHLPRVVQLSARYHDVRAVALADGAHAVEARLIVEPFAVAADGRQGEARPAVIDEFGHRRYPRSRSRANHDAA